ncbi:hypothetical protein ALE3EI_0573 [Constantimarinum furrinae]|uniref:DUF1697 domain-containing protein n=2 Tax=Constantimarinum furrinae TaxID=2562285 RepID=A0A7G8PS35_9FLAO|nr:hypothetical protein ALE3EI_0573 [Constantimarinum furrinae]
MKTYIALLRGINVGGHKKILMKDLRALFERIGYSEVASYIQSGNMVFSSESDTEHDKRISEAIEEAYGWDVPVLVKTSDEIKAILDECPFPKEKKESAYFMLLFKQPVKEDIERLKTFQFQDEEFVLSPKCIYFYSAVDPGKSKLNNNFFEKKLKVTATTRNFRTLQKLVELSD